MIVEWWLRGVCRKIVDYSYFRSCGRANLTVETAGEGRLQDGRSAIAGFVYMR